MVGPKKQDFWPRINKSTKENFQKNWLMNYRSSKSAKIILSKSIFYVKNQPIKKKKKSFKNINVGDHFLVKTFFSRFNF
jgi:hypothetical protein